MAGKLLDIHEQQREAAAVRTEVFVSRKPELAGKIVQRTRAYGMVEDEFGAQPVEFVLDSTGDRHLRAWMVELKDTPKERFRATVYTFDDKTVEQWRHRRSGKLFNASHEATGSAWTRRGMAGYVERFRLMSDEQYARFAPMNGKYDEALPYGDELKRPPRLGPHLIGVSN